MTDPNAKPSLTFSTLTGQGAPLDRLAREYWLGAVWRSENTPRNPGDDLRAVIRSDPVTGLSAHLAIAALHSRPIRKFRSVGEAAEFVRGAAMFRDGHISPAEIETAKERLGPTTAFERGESDG